MDSISKVNALCKKILSLTDDDIKSVVDMANEQSSYTHPLKVGKQAKFNKLGSYNQKVIADLVRLIKTLQSGKSTPKN